jgi:hypothetical protein
VVPMHNKPRASRCYTILRQSLVGTLTPPSFQSLTMPCPVQAKAGGVPTLPDISQGMPGSKPRSPTGRGG